MFTPKQFDKATTTKKHASRLPIFMLGGACEWGKAEVVEQIATLRGVASFNMHTLWAPKEAQLSNELFTDFDDEAERLLIVRAEAEGSEPLHRFLRSPTPGLTVVVWLPSSRFKPRGEFFDSMERAGWVIMCRPLRRVSLTRWAEAWLRDRGFVFADGRALQVLLDRAGSDRRVVAMELEKLSCYAGQTGRELVSFKDVQRCIFDHQSDDILDFLIAISARNRVQALQLLGRLWAPGTGAGRGLLRVLVRRLKQIRQVHAMLSTRPTVQEVAEKLKVNYYFIPALLAAARNFKRTEIEQFVEQLVFVGRRLFTADGRFLFERAILEL